MCDYLLLIGIVKDIIVYYVVHNCQCADEMMHAEVMLNFYIKILLFTKSQIAFTCVQRTHHGHKVLDWQFFWLPSSLPDRHAHPPMSGIAVYSIFTIDDLDSAGSVMCCMVVAPRSV